MPEYIGGDMVGRDKITQRGRGNSLTVNNSGGVSQAEIDAAADELRAFIAQLRRDGIVSADGGVTDPVAVVGRVQSQPGRLKALSRAIAGGAKDAVLSLVKDGVADLVVALVGRM